MDEENLVSLTKLNTFQMNLPLSDQNISILILG